MQEVKLNYFYYFYTFFVLTFGNAVQDNSLTPTFMLQNPSGVTVTTHPGDEFSFLDAIPLVIDVRCLGYKPTELIFSLDWDLEDLPSRFGYTTIESSTLNAKIWTNRELDQKTSKWIFSSQAILKYKKNVHNWCNISKWGCKYVDSLQSAQLLFGQNSSTRTLHVIRDDNIAISGDQHSGNHCPIKMYYFISANNNIYVQCKHRNGMYMTNFRTISCVSWELCHTLFRDAQNKTCVKEAEAEEEKSMEYSTEWYPVDVDTPSVIVCWNDQERGASHVFFTGPPLSWVTRTYKIHFAGIEVALKQHMQLEFLNQEEESVEDLNYEIGDDVIGKCSILRYGISLPIYIQLYHDSYDNTPVPYPNMAIEELTHKDAIIQNIIIRTLRVKKVEHGIYTMMCKAPIQNTAEWVTVSRSFFVNVTESPTFPNKFNHQELIERIPAQKVVIGTAAVCAVILVLWFLASYLSRWKAEKKLNALKHKFLKGFLDEESTIQACGFLSLPIDTRKHLKRLRRDRSTPLGSGNFGFAFKDEIIDDAGKRVTVVAKGLNLGNRTLAGMETFLKEIKMMVFISHSLGGHENIVRCLGADIHRFFDKQIFLIMEYCDSGSLKEYLDKVDTLPRSTCYKMALQIANGMHFLSKAKITHNDLAARNILLDKQYNAKISDFGFSRPILDTNYYKSSFRTLPVLWLAAEVIKDGRMTTLSDIWSYGVTVWEIFSFGAEPEYHGVGSLQELLDALNAEIRLKPFSDSQTYEFIKQCWDLEPKKRPPFEQLSAYFDEKFKNADTTTATESDSLPFDVVVVQPGCMRYLPPEQITFHGYAAT